MASLPRSLRILLVESDDALAAYFRAVLTARGHRVDRERDDGAAASAATPDLDVLVVHVVRPPPAGTATLESIRRRAEYRDLPVIVLTTLPPRHFAQIRRVATGIHRMPFPLAAFAMFVEDEAGRGRFPN